MLDVLGIILLVVFGLMIYVGITCNIQYSDYYSSTITIGVILVLTLIFSSIDKSNPTAMDVYQGKTTLEITYKDGIAIDSTVVFKERK